MVSEQEHRPTLVLNPVDDGDFRAIAERLLEYGYAEPALFQDCLRTRWPRAIVRPRELAGEQTAVWYVYRDGHWIRPSS